MEPASVQITVAAVIWYEAAVFGWTSTGSGTMSFIEPAAVVAAVALVAACAV